MRALRWCARLPFGELEQKYEFVALTDGDRYPLERGRLASSSGLDIGPTEYRDHFEEHQVSHSTALHSRLRGGGSYLVGPLARYALNAARLSPLAREAAAEAGLNGPCRNPYRSIVVRAVEVLYALDEALRIIAAYEEPDAPAVEVVPHAGVGHGWTEAPRGTLYHRYCLDEDGTVTEAVIVPPTSQNRRAVRRREGVHTPSTTLSAASSVAPTAVPAAAERHVVGRKAAGTSSTATRESIAPAAKASDSASSAEICSTRRKAITAPTGWGRLVATAVQNWRARVSPASSMGIAIVVPSGTFWTAIATITKSPRPDVSDA